VASRAMLGQKDARGAKANDDDAGKGTLRMILSVMGGGGLDAHGSTYVMTSRSL